MIPLAERIGLPRIIERTMRSAGKIIRIDTRVENQGALRSYMDERISYPRLVRGLGQLPRNGYETHTRILEEEISQLEASIDLGVAASTGLVFLDIPIGPRLEHQVRPKSLRGGGPVLIWDESLDNERFPEKPSGDSLPGLGY